MNPFGYGFRINLSWLTRIEKYRMNEQEQKISKISIIIPTLNEAQHIKATIASTLVASNIEVIIADGDSQDDTVEIAENAGAKIVYSHPGRAQQMNAGALVADGEILLFLHADTRLPSKFDNMVREVLQCQKTIAGAFTLKIDASQWSLRLVEWGVSIRSSYFQLPYGDQAIFLTKKVFEQIGGFPELPIMEDFEMVSRLKRNGNIAIIPAPVLTSARRWLKKGIMKTTLINQIVIIAYHLGVSPERIQRWYRK